MERDLIWEVVKWVIIFFVIFESEPFVKLSNKILLKLRLPKVVNHLLECGWCLVFWTSLGVSIYLQSTTPVAVAMLTAHSIQKLFN